MIQLQRLLTRRWFKIPVMVFVVALSSLAAILLAFACHARVWTWNDSADSYGDARLYLTMLEGRHPLIEDLRTGRIRAGDDIDKLISRTKPAGVHRYKEYIQVNYRLPDFTGLWIAAKDGKLVYASALQGSSWQGGQCLWAKTFFNDLSQKERQELSLWLGIVD